MNLPVIVLGMHKSGTTLVSEILHHSGIRMIEKDDEKGYDKGNHYERQATNDLNKELLNCGTINSLRVTNELSLSDVSAETEERSRATIQAIRNAERHWGFKDPRNCLTYGFWSEILGDHKLVCVFRDAQEVHLHYVKRHSLRPSRGIRALHAWYVYNDCMYRAALASKPGTSILINYSELMSGEEEFNRLKAFIEHPLADKRVQGMRRSKPKSLTRFQWDCFWYKRLYGKDIQELSIKILALHKRLSQAL